MSTAWTPPLTLPLAGGRSLEIDSSRPAVMGIVNVTPDSFSDGGRFLDPARAVDHGLRLLDEGADLLDLGAESTRPGGGVYGKGMDVVPADEELRRLLPVLEGLRRQSDAILSVDTRKGTVARAALDAGADLVNDVGGLGDPELSAAVATAGCTVVVMHSRGDLSTMQRCIDFVDVVDEVGRELAESVEVAAGAEIRREQIVLDPGIGFGKTAAQNVELLAGLPRLAALGLPLLVGASRKSFIAATTTPDGEEPPAPAARLGGSLAAACWSAEHAAILRVHDVRETVQALRLWRALRQAR